MKKVLIVFAMIFVMACGGKKEATVTEEYASQDDKPKMSSAEQIIEGEKLVKASDCKTCHHQTNKIIGPSHTDVAKKYEFTEANVKMLATKIVQGGSGNWGEIQMMAHADMTMSDAEKMARYVLSLDGEKEH